MKIGVIGSGNVGGTLGKRWAANGHQVTFSSRDPESGEMKKLLGDAGSNARAASTAEAILASDIAVLAVPWEAVRDVVEGADLSGKIVIDATNPLLPELAGLSVGTTTSAGEQVAEWAHGAKVVKAFNTVGFGIMANPKFADKSAVLFYCGDDAESKKVVGGLATELGFNAVDAGPLKQARLLEPFALLWISLTFTNGRGIAFDFLRRD